VVTIGALRGAPHRLDDGGEAWVTVHPSFLLRVRDNREAEYARFVGEQPGDQEDLVGQPFVGPAGQLFDRAMADAGVDRASAYVTNAVKHFKFERRGKRRIHQKPDGPEIMACRFWLEQEQALVRPPILVALGATAARSIFGKVVTIGALRGKPHALETGGEAWVTVHPSFLLRVRDNRDAEYARFVEDLQRIGERAKALA
jgi:DNA polymerase